MFIVPTVLCFSFSARPLRFALTVGALMLAGGTYAAAQEHATHRGRSFFGVHRVFELPERNLRYLIHGGVVHGIQHLDSGKRREPSTYFHKTGPIGQVFTAFQGRPDKSRVGVIGLGIGTLAAYSEAGQEWTFYEIDPAIADLASDPRQFTYLSDSPARKRIVLGDARIALVKEPARAFDVLVVDAFSSDAVPVHLLTREALQLYLAEARCGGVHRLQHHQQLPESHTAHRRSCRTMQGSSFVSSTTCWLIRRRYRSARPHRAGRSWPGRPTTSDRSRRTRAGRRYRRDPPQKHGRMISRIR